MREEFRINGLSEDAANIIMNPWNCGPSNQYSPNILHCCNFTSGTNEAHSMSVLMSVQNFCHNIFFVHSVNIPLLILHGLRYRNIFNIVNIFLGKGLTFDKQPIIRSLLKVMFKKSRHFPRYRVTFDVIPVLDFIKKSDVLIKHL